MDLGFGTSNQQIGSVATNALLRTAEAQEVAVHDEMQRYDALLSDDDALAQLRTKRLQEMQREAANRQKYMAAGHGTYQELGDGSQQDTRDIVHSFFDATKASERVVVHFYRPTTALCDVLHKHLELLAAKHLETRFLKLNVQDCDVSERGATFLVQRLKVTVMPTLLLVQNRQVIHQIRGFDELGGTDSFSTNMLAHVLSRHGVLQSTDDEVPDEHVQSGRHNRNNLHGSSLNRSSKEQRQRYDEDDQEDF